MIGDDSIYDLWTRIVCRDPDQKRPFWEPLNLIIFNFRVPVLFPYGQCQLLKITDLHKNLSP